MSEQMNISAPMEPNRRPTIDKLVQDLRPLIERLVRRRLQHHSITRNRAREEDVEDLVQEVFEKLVAHDRRALTMHDPRLMSLPAWVHLIADRLVSSILRSPRRNPCFLEPVDAQTLEEYLESAEHDAAVYDPQHAHIVWHRAGPRTRQVLQGLLNGYEIDEIPALTGMSQDAVHQACSRLRKIASTVVDAKPTRAQ